jgi:hypothetical protein
MALILASGAVVLACYGVLKVLAIPPINVARIRNPLYSYSSNTLQYTLLHFTHAPYALRPSFSTAEQQNSQHCYFCSFHICAFVHYCRVFANHQKSRIVHEPPDQNEAFTSISRWA